MVNPFLLYKDDRLNDDLALHRHLQGRADAHHGLHFEKLFGRWQQTSDHPAGHDLSQGALLDWLSSRREKGDWVTRRIGSREFLDRANDRTRRLVEARVKARFGEAVAQSDAVFTLRLVSRLMTGLGLPHPTENGFLFHPTLGVPYVPGTALKQVAQDRAQEIGIDDDTRFRLFGNLEEHGGNHLGVGCLAFLDSLPLEPVTLTADQTTSHYAPYYGSANPALGEAPSEVNQPADWHEPIPVTLLAVHASEASPLPFQLTILPLRGASRMDLDAAREWLTDGLTMNGVGAKTTLGYGRFVSESEQLRRQQDEKRRQERWAQQDDEARARAEAEQLKRAQGSIEEMRKNRQKMTRGRHVRLDTGESMLLEADHVMGSGEPVQVSNVENGKIKVDESEIADWGI